MATTDRNIIKSWFKRGLKPLETQFAAWIDSFWHKDDPIPISSVENLQQALNSKTTEQYVSITVSDAFKNIELPSATLERKGVVQLSSTAGFSETEAATPCLVSQVCGTAVNALLEEVYTKSQTEQLSDEKIGLAVEGLRGGVPAEGDTLSKLYALTLLLQTLVTSDDVNLDTVREIVAFIKNNKDVIDTIATSKVAITDIVDGLASTAANKPLSANQGRILSETLSTASKVIQLAVGFSVSTEAVIYLPAAATVSKLTWSATDIATVQVSVAGGAFTPITSGTALNLALAPGSPLQVKITYATGKTIGSILLEGTYS